MVRRPPQGNLRRKLVWSLAAFAGVAAVGLFVNWQLYETENDSEIHEGDSEISEDAVVGNVEIDGLDSQQAADALKPMQQEVAETNIELQFIELQFQDRSVTVPVTEFTAAELGISLDVEQTLASADAPAPPVVRPASWLFDLFASHDVTPAMTTDLEVLTTLVEPYSDPQTPSIELVDDAFRPVLQTDVGIPDMELLAERLKGAVSNNVGGKAVVEVPLKGLSQADPVAVKMAADLAAQANAITQGGVVVQLEGTDTTFAIGESEMRQFITLEGQNQDTHLSVDDRILDTLASLFVGVGTPGGEAKFDIDDSGAVTITTDEPGFKCCHETTPQRLLEAMQSDEPVVVLPSTPAMSPRNQDWAESLGILQVVGEFTTRFAAGQDRVINISRISNLTRGVIIEPGGQFSVNDHVGRRTAANGFVPAKMIREGVFVDSVGGGISQYATTLFNAAFFAGLDFVDYQAHTIYLSRYPYGREATVSFPAPDLVIENNTPYGVMIWPTTNEDSITVRLYSTPWVLASQTNQWTRTVGTSCTRVTTERTRTYLSDQRSETDTVWAQYRPEGLRCDGSPSVTTTTTIPAPSTTIPPEPSGEDGWEQGGSTGGRNTSQSDAGSSTDGSPTDETSANESSIDETPTDETSANGSSIDETNGNSSPEATTTTNPSSESS